jgi:hypothetical protein
LARAERQPCAGVALSALRNALDCRNRSDDRNVMKALQFAQMRITPDDEISATRVAIAA